MPRSVRTGSFVVVSGLLAGLGACGGGGGGGGGSLPPGDTTPYLHQLYVFRSPANANDTVLIVTLNAGAGTDNPTTFAPTQRVRIHTDATGSFSAAVSFDASFGPPDGSGVQTVTLRHGANVLAQGNTGQNIPVVGGGQFRAGLQDDPFFLDQAALDAYLDGGIVFPAVAPANAYGPNENCLAVVLELPSNTLGPANSLLHVWAATDVNFVQNDRLGRAMTRDLLLEPVPRGPVTGFAPDSQSVYRANDDPALDETLFAQEMRGIYIGFYDRTAPDATALTTIFLPDALVFQVGNPNGYGTFVTSGTGQGGEFAGTVFGNGRRLRDDVVDILINITTNGLETNDGVADDNGARITDGNLGSSAGFPFIGAPNP